LIGSGLVNAWMLVGSPGRLITTPYGQLLIVKVCLLGGMLCARGAKPLSPSSHAAEVEARPHAGRGAAPRGSAQRIDRADARTADRSNRRWAGNPATRDRRIRLESALRHPLADAKLSRNP